MSGPRDLRDPALLGAKYLRFREVGMSIDEAVQWPAFDYRSDESCIDKYGRPDDVKPVFESIQTK